MKTTKLKTRQISPRNPDEQN